MPFVHNITLADNYEKLTQTVCKHSLIPPERTVWPLAALHVIYVTRIIETTPSSIIIIKCC
jgi:hypothetical protein